MMVLYPLWWSGIVTMAIFYFTFVLFFLPLWYIDDVIKEMGNYSFSLMIILVGLTIYSSQRFLVPLFTLGVILGGIYMVYLLFKNRGKK